MENSRLLMNRLLKSSGVRFEGYSTDGHSLSPEDILTILGPMVSEDRQARINEVIDHRTYGIAPVVEGLANTGNVSAVMRTSEGLGFQPFHVIRNDIKFKKSVRTSQGAHKWLDVSIWDDAPECTTHLKDLGYQIVVTHLDDAARPLSEIDLTTPTAMVFGNEKFGVSEAMLAAADYTAILPSPGFVQSYNISVAAAMSLYAAYDQRARAFGEGGDLSESEKTRLRADFYMRSVNHVEKVLKRHLGLL
jgi:tRNA (guanosine-2'-O-)-methyltransferase